MARFLVFFLISTLLHLALLCGAGRLDFTESMISASYSERAGESSIKARLIVQETKRKLPAKGAQKTAVPKQQTPVTGQAAVEDRSESERESGSADKLASYLSDVRELILKNKYKLPIASRLKLTGVSKISFKIGSPNILKDLQVLKTSGKKPLDDSALESVRRVSSLPSIPEELQLTEITIVLEMEFE